MSFLANIKGAYDDINNAFRLLYLVVMIGIGSFGLIEILAASLILKRLWKKFRN